MKAGLRACCDRGLRIVAIAAALCATATSHADVRADPVGGGGGGPFAARCPPGQFLTGVELRTGDDVDTIRPLCVLAYDKTTPKSAFARLIDAPAETPTKVAAAGYATAPIVGAGGDVHVTIVPQQPSISALVTLKADGVSHHCEGVSLRFGDGSPEEFVPLRRSHNAVGMPQQFERSHKASQAPTRSKGGDAPATTVARTSSQRSRWS